MLKLVVFGFGLVGPSIALACDGHTEAHAATASVEATAADATACAKKASLVGANCSYTTGMMAQRVLTEGTPWSFTGSLSSSDNALASHVAAPYTVGPDKVNVVANEVLEGLTAAGVHTGRVGLEGKRLEVGGVTYFVLTSYSVPSS